MLRVPWGLAIIHHIVPDVISPDHFIPAISDRSVENCKVVSVKRWFLTIDDRAFYVWSSYTIGTIGVRKPSLPEMHPKIK